MSRFLNIKVGPRCLCVAYEYDSLQRRNYLLVYIFIKQLILNAPILKYLFNYRLKSTKR